MFSLNTRASAEHRQDMFLSFRVKHQTILCFYDDLFFLRHVKGLVRGGGLSKLTGMLLADPPYLVQTESFASLFRWLVVLRKANKAMQSHHGGPPLSGTPTRTEHTQQQRCETGREQLGGKRAGVSPQRWVADLHQLGPSEEKKQPRGSSISSSSPGWPAAVGETASALSYRSVCMWSACTHTFLHGLGELEPH